MSKSNAEQVVLKKVQINSSGHYKCEVSEDCPVYWKGLFISPSSSTSQVTTKKDTHYAVGPPFDAVSAVGRLQVVGEI